EGHDAYAGRDGWRAAEHRADPRREPGGGGVRDDALGLRHQNPELVAPETAHHVRLADGAARCVGHEPQHGIARGVAVYVVHLLEVVEIQVYHGQRTAVAAVATELLRQLRREGPCVEHVGERVVGGELLQLRLRAPQL